MLEPYDDLPSSIGHNTTSPESIRRTAQLALQHDYQLCVHAIGDRANRVVLDLYEEVAGASLGERRWRIEHAQHIHPDDMPRFGKLGVIAAMQGNHCTSDAPFVATRLGQRRAAQGAYAWRSLLDHGALLVNGTDTPVEKVDPLGSFHASVTRKTAEGAFYPKQCMTREEALCSYTRNAAFAAFEEEIKGTLEAGKLADMVVLSHDILAVDEAELLDTEVLYTIMGGRVLYEKGRRNF
jgi:predicted amidohydrolase YtcJ